jgi:flagellin FlaB
MVQSNSNSQIQKGEQKMNAKLNRMMKDESGVTALETAIILIAFVVVAAIFAFTILSTGTFLTEKSKEAAYAGLQEVRGSMELKGSMVLEKKAANGDVIVFNLANVSGGSSVDLAKVTMFYRDQTINQLLGKQTTNCAATVQPTAADTWCIDDSTLATADQGKDYTILKSGNIVKIRVFLTTAIAPNITFAIEVKPPSGGTMLIERTAPALISAVTDLK